MFLHVSSLEINHFNVFCLFCEWHKLWYICLLALWALLLSSFYWLLYLAVWRQLLTWCYLLLYWLSVFVVEWKGELFILVNWTVLQLEIVGLEGIGGGWEFICWWDCQVFCRSWLSWSKLIFHHCKSVDDHLSQLLRHNRLLDILFRLFLIRFEGIEHFKQLLLVAQVILPGLVALTAEVLSN